MASYLKLHEPNPRYFEYRGRPVILIGSSEHYGAIINGNFNYLKYLDSLRASGLNVTRVFSGQYRERPGKFEVDPSIGPDLEIFENTLAPECDAFVAPWRRSEVPGAADGGNKFDLDHWNEEYFARLTDFVEKAEERGIVVELSFFSPYYVNVIGERFWEISAWNGRNNINGIGVTDGAAALSLEYPALVSVQEALIRKAIAHLCRFGNVYFEICNEPYAGHVPLSWQAHIAAVIKDAGVSVGRDFLIMQEFSDLTNGALLEGIKEPAYRQAFLENGVEKRVPKVSLLAFHNPLPQALIETHHLGLPRGQNENCQLLTDASNRISAWRVIMSGGAFHHGTDFSFTVGHEDGSFPLPPGNSGGGSATLRSQLGVLARFFQDLDSAGMRPEPVITSSLPKGVLADSFGKSGISYAIYFSEEFYAASTGERPATVDFAVTLGIPAGQYAGYWLEPKNGRVVGAARVDANSMSIVAPAFQEDIALRLDRVC